MFTSPSPNPNPPSPPLPTHTHLNPVISIPASGPTSPETTKRLNKLNAGQRMISSGQPISGLCERLRSATALAKRSGLFVRPLSELLPNGWPGCLYLLSSPPSSPPPPPPTSSMSSVRATDVNEASLRSSPRLTTFDCNHILAVRSFPRCMQITTDLRTRALWMSMKISRGESVSENGACAGVGKHWHQSK